MFLKVSQTASGGYNLRDHVVGDVVFIQCDGRDAGWTRFYEILSKYEEDYLESCECCGDRWTSYSEDLFEFVETDKYDDYYVVHYLNGDSFILERDAVHKDVIIVEQVNSPRELDRHW